MDVDPHTSTLNDQMRTLPNHTYDKFGMADQPHSHFTNFVPIRNFPQQLFVTAPTLAPR